MVKLPRIRLPDSLGRLLNPVLVACVFVGVVVMLASLTMRSEEKKEVTAKANAMSSPIIDLCLVGDETSRILASARTPDGKSLCEAAAEVKTDPVTAQVPDLDEGRIRELIAAELAKRQDQSTPDMGQLVAAAQTVILNNAELFQGQPGEPASPAEIAAVVSTYIRANADMFRGRPGERGRMGPSGRPGDSFGGLNWTLRGGRCLAVIDIVTPSGQRQETAPVPMALCREPTIPTATTTVTPPPTTVTATPDPDEDPDPTTTPTGAPSVTPTPTASLEPSEPPTEGG